MTATQRGNPEPNRLWSLARPDGTFVMVAMDQRESLRSMLGDAGAAHADADLTAFKRAVAAELSPYASGFLLDAEFGLDPVLDGGDLHEGTGLIVAADALVPWPAVPGRPAETVGDASFDTGVDLARARDRGAAAAKLLVVWREDGHESERLDHAYRFTRACRDAGLASVVEGVVRPAPGREDFDREDFDREATLHRCARELAACEPDLYKTEVPLLGRAESAAITRSASRITEAVGCPWVVLSSLVERADFPGAVEAACRGGASGLLAGRAVWSNVLGRDDHRHALRDHSVPYLRRLGRVVADHGRPLPDAPAGRRAGW